MIETVYESTDASLYCGDCLEYMKSLPDNRFDMTITSPPYEDARTYGVGFNLKGQAWVDWAVERFVECVRVTKGVTAWVIEGRTRDFQWSATPALFMADLHRRGIKLRKPPIFQRFGIAGSGGDEWLKNNYEFVVCATKGRLDWSDNTAMGKPPVFGPGGDPTNRKQNGDRVGKRPYSPPALANPGNIIADDIINCGAVGGGNMGSDLSAKTEAPFPEKLAKFLTLSFCPPDGLLFDPFCGSGTSLSVAIQHGRRAVGVDVRMSQMEISCGRVLEARERLKAGAA